MINYLYTDTHSLHWSRICRQSDHPSSLLAHPIPSHRFPTGCSNHSLLQHLRGLNQVSLCKQYSWKQWLVSSSPWRYGNAATKIDQCITFNNKEIFLNLFQTALTNFKTYSILRKLKSSWRLNPAFWYFYQKIPDPLVF